MDHILSILKKEGLECLPCDRVNLDIERFSEYRDSNEHPAEALFERPPLTDGKTTVMQIDRRIPTILHYFLDGSRRTYKISDVIKDGRYLPLIAGQIGVAVVKRQEDGCGVAPLREFCHFKNVIVFPDVINDDDLAYLQEKINTVCKTAFILLSYEVQRKTDRDPVDLGVARIMSEMHDLEISTVNEMAQRHLLANDRMLVLDGSLRFTKRFDIVQFRNVVGLSKNFRPSFRIGNKGRRKDIGLITSGLDFGERTSAFKTTEGEKTIGMWYVRIRPRQQMSNPLQGVVKLECYAIDPEDIESGLDTERINTLSGQILRERNVTPFNADSRWASHIYPIYLAESYIKCSLMSDTFFKALF